MKKLNIVLSVLFSLAAVSAQADVANAEKIAQKYTTIARIINPEYAGPSAIAGKHIITGKAIRPLPPAVNDKRFNDIENVEDKFTVHCNDIIGSDCTPEEKANFIGYLLTEKTPSAKK
jgi:hypothetical protein